MSLDAEMSHDIVVLLSTDFSDHWSKVARERIRSEANEIGSLDISKIFTGIPMHLISN